MRTHGANFIALALVSISLASLVAIDTGFAVDAIDPIRTGGASHSVDAASGARAISADPCDDGISDITGTIQACTMITDSLGISSTVLTTSLQIVAGIQDAETGPTTHYSHTVDGQAFWYGLHTTRPWFVAVQVGDFPLTNVRHVGPFQIFDVYVGDAVTFHFECIAEPCYELAMTPTPRPTWLTPTRSATPTPTITGTPTITATSTITGTPTLTPDPTVDPFETPVPSETAEATPPPPTDTPIPPTNTPDPPTEEPPTPTLMPSATAVPTPTSPTPTLHPIYMPVVTRRW